MIDFKKPVKTRDGQKVTIFTTKAHLPFEVWGEYLLEGVWIPAQWTSEGSFFSVHTKHGLDLVNEPKSYTIYMAVVKGGEKDFMLSCSYDNLEEFRDRTAHYKILASKKITFIEGELI